MAGICNDIGGSSNWKDAKLQSRISSLLGLRVEFSIIMKILSQSMKVYAILVLECVSLRVCTL